MPGTVSLVLREHPLTAPKSKMRRSAERETR